MQLYKYVYIINVAKMGMSAIERTCEVIAESNEQAIAAITKAGYTPLHLLNFYKIAIPWTEIYTTKV